MGYYTKEPAFSGGVGNQKSRVEIFSDDTFQNAPSRLHESLVREGFRAVGNTTCTPGVRLYGYRYYSPELGRWISKDPIGERGGLNVYAFVGNGPISLIDPFGLQSEESGNATCCEVERVWVEWVGHGWALVDGSSFTFTAKWEVNDPSLCEAAQFITMSAEIPGVSREMVIASYAHITTPGHLHPDGWPDYPFSENRLDWGWKALPYTDNPTAVGPGEAQDSSGQWKPLPTIFTFSAVVRVRDKATQEIVASTAFGLKYKNFNNETGVPFLSNENSSLYDIFGFEGDVQVAE